MSVRCCQCPVVRIAAHSPLSPATPCFAARDGDEEERRREVDGVDEGATAMVRVAALDSDERERAPKAVRVKGADAMMMRESVEGYWAR